MTVEEAKELMTPEALEKLRKMVSKPTEIDFSKKVNCDLVMSALCKAVQTGVIPPKSLNEKLIKLLNSDTSTISDSTLNYILDVVHKHQPTLALEITLYEANMDQIAKWTMFRNTRFNVIFDFILTRFEITPQMVRAQLIDTYRPTIVNNLGQLVSRFQAMSSDEKFKQTISISTIQRLVAMSKRIIMADFVVEPEGSDINNNANGEGEIYIDMKVEF